MDEIECKEDTESHEPIEFKSGQKFPTPSPGNGDRVFYETLLEQRPDSEMAQEWCVFYGVLDEEKAFELFKKICKRKGAKPPTPVKKSAGKPASKAAVQPKKKKSKKTVVDDDVEVDTGMAESSVWEGQGSMGI